MILIVRKIVLFAFLLVFTAIATWGISSSVQPSFSQSTSRFSLTQPNTRIYSAGDIQYASIRLDGVVLFQITSQDVVSSGSELGGSLSPIEVRVQRIERNLYNLINIGFNPKTLDVKPSILNNLTVIVASDPDHLSRSVILTVTETDALIASSSVTDLANEWSQILRRAMIQAWQTRQPEARKRQIARVGIIALGMMIMGVLLIWCQKKLRQRFDLLKKKAGREFLSASESLATSSRTDGLLQASPQVSSSFYTEAKLQQQLMINMLLQRLDQIGFVLLCFGSAAAILWVFPETRLEGRILLGIPVRIFIICFILTLIGNLASLYTNYRLQEWTEVESVISENPQRRILRAPTILEVSRGMIRFVAWCIGIIWFLLWTGLFPSSFLTGAGILGAALTFSFRDLLKDWINGILIIFEDQYAVGDMLEFAGLIGTVENMSLRVTQIRTADGRLTTIPHNQVTIAHNLTKDWSRVNFIIEVAYSTDPNVAIALMTQIAQDMAKDSQWQDDIIDPVNVVGVNRVAHSGMEIMIRIRVKRLRQWDVEREFRRRLKLAFDERDIQIGVPQQNLLFDTKS